ncbi:hypothetical protein WDU94_009678 [Cyamophila willieti]
MSEIINKEAPAESFNVSIKSKPESVLPAIPNKTSNKPNQAKKVIKPKGAPLPKLNVKPKRESPSNPPPKKDAHKNCLLENTDINFTNPKTRRFGKATDSQRTNPKSKSRQSIKSQKLEETIVETTELIDQDKNMENIEFNDCLGPSQMKDELERQRDFMELTQKEIDHSHKELDPIVHDYDCSIRTVSSISVHSGSDDSQKHLVRKSSKPDRDRGYQSKSSDKPPCSEHNWKVTVASEKGNNKQASPNIELHLSMNASEQSRENRKSNPRQSNKMNLSLTLKNFCGDSDISPSSRQDNFYEKEKTFSDQQDLYSKKHFKNLTQAEDTGSVRSSTAMSFHEDHDKDDFTSTKRTTMAEEGLLSVTGSYITPEMRPKPPTMSEKDLSLYKNSKK